MTEKGIVVGLNINNAMGMEESLQELVNLCIACDIEVIHAVTQNAKKINASYYIGAGKLQEIAELMEEDQASVVIFNHELSPTQLKNIEAQLGCQILDRTALILTIFAQRAKTREAKLQVEVARLQYELPRLIGANENLGRQSGGVGTKNRGAGETKLALDKRRLEARIAEHSHELEALKAQRMIQRQKRSKSNTPLVALVGYTNAGKSSVMNHMLTQFTDNEEKQVFAKDMMFATLETAVRSIRLPDNKQFLLSDTVGFISQLPHHLVKAFRSTLEEVCVADLLLHVIDVANPHYPDHIKVTEETLAHIGAGHIPALYVYNKVDLVENLAVGHDGVYVSAKKNIGMDRLLEVIGEHIFRDYHEGRLLVPYEQGQLISYINQHATVKGCQYTEQGALLTVQYPEQDRGKYSPYLLE